MMMETSCVFGLQQHAARLRTVRLALQSEELVRSNRRELRRLDRATSLALKSVAVQRIWFAWRSVCKKQQQERAENAMALLSRGFGALRRSILRKRASLLSEQRAIAHRDERRKKTAFLKLRKKRVVSHWLEIYIRRRERFVGPVAAKRLREKLEDLERRRRERTIFLLWKAETQKGHARAASRLQMRYALSQWHRWRPKKKIVEDIIDFRRRAFRKLFLRSRKNRAQRLADCRALFFFAQKRFRDMKRRLSEKRRFTLRATSAEAHLIVHRCQRALSRWRTREFSQKLDFLLTSCFARFRSGILASKKRRLALLMAERRAKIRYVKQWRKKTAENKLIAKRVRELLFWRCLCRFRAEQIRRRESRRLAAVGRAAEDVFRARRGLRSLRALRSSRRSQRVIPDRRLRFLQRWYLFASFRRRDRLGHDKAKFKVLRRSFRKLLTSQNIFAKAAQFHRLSMKRRGVLRFLQYQKRSLPEEIANHLLIRRAFISSALAVWHAKAQREKRASAYRQGRLLKGATFLVPFAMRVLETEARMKWTKRTCLSLADSWHRRSLLRRILLHWRLASLAPRHERPPVPISLLIETI